jgi:hypothetical protein
MPKRALGLTALEESEQAGLKPGSTEAGLPVLGRDPRASAGLGKTPVLVEELLLFLPAYRGDQGRCRSIGSSQGGVALDLVVGERQSVVLGSQAWAVCGLLQAEARQ